MLFPTLVPDVGIYWLVVDRLSCRWFWLVVCFRCYSLYLIDYWHTCTVFVHFVIWGLQKEFDHWILFQSLPRVCRTLLCLFGLKGWGGVYTHTHFMLVHLPPATRWTTWMCLQQHTRTPPHGFQCVSSFLCSGSVDRFTPRTYKGSRGSLWRWKLKKDEGEQRKTEREDSSLMTYMSWT